MDAYATKAAGGGKFILLLCCHGLSMLDVIDSQDTALLIKPKIYFNCIFLSFLSITENI